MVRGSRLRCEASAWQPEEHSRAGMCRPAAAFTLPLPCSSAAAERTRVGVCVGLKATAKRVAAHAAHHIQGTVPLLGVAQGCGTGFDKGWG